MRAVISTLESHQDQFGTQPVGVIGQLIVCLDLTGTMLAKSGKPTSLLKACAKALQDRVDELSKEELLVLSETLAGLSKH